MKKKLFVLYPVISKEDILDLYSLKLIFLLKYHQNHTDPHTTKGTGTKAASEVTNDVATTRKLCLIIVPAIMFEKLFFFNQRHILF